MPNKHTLTARYWGPRLLSPVRFPHMEAALSCCICCCSCWAMRFCSLSFWVSANFTTMGDEHPLKTETGWSTISAGLNDHDSNVFLGNMWSVTSMVWDWCMDLMADWAICLAVNVTNAQPESEKHNILCLRLTRKYLCTNLQASTYYPLFPMHSFICGSQPQH